MSKDEVYSWRLSRSIKLALEEAAQEHGLPIAELLERAVREYLSRQGRREDDGRAQRIRSAAMTFVGAIAGGDPRRAERSRRLVRARLRKRHAR